MMPNGAQQQSSLGLAHCHANATYRQVYGATDRKNQGKNLRFMWQPDRQEYFSPHST